MLRGLKTFNTDKQFLYTSEILAFLLLLLRGLVSFVWCVPCDHLQNKKQYF